MSQRPFHGVRAPFTIAQFTDYVKEAVKGKSAASDIKEAVARLLKTNGIHTPHKK